MPFRHQITDDYVHIQWYGKLVRADLQEIGALIPKLARTLQRTPHLLHTFDEVAGSTLQPLDAFQHTLHLQDTPIPEVSRTAVVANNDQTRPMASLFCALNRHPNLLMEIFESKRQAIAWLRSKPRSTPSRPRATSRSGPGENPNT